MRLNWKAYLARLQEYWQKNSRYFAIALLVFLLVVAFFSDRIFISIMPGEAGVLWRRFDDGLDLDKVYGEGLHVIMPWDMMTIYDVRIQELHDTVEFLDNNGLAIAANVSIRFLPDRKNLPRFHQRIGPKYREKVIIPELVSALRLVLGNRAYQETYTQPEAQFNTEIRQQMEDALAKNDMILDEVLLIGFSIPDEIKTAIQTKLVFEQELLTYAYRLDTEQKEKQRKKVEGEGVAEFENASNISILQWQGIKATQDLAKSPNAKVVIIGNDAGSLPVILSQ